MSDLSHLHAPRPLWLSALDAPWLRRAAVLILLAAIWELAAVIQNNPIMLPRFSAVVVTLWQSILNDGLLGSARVSIEVLLKGYVIAVALALLLVGLAAANSFAREALQTLTAMLNPLPAIALLPLAMLWFGLNEASLIFVLCHAVVWPLALAALSGFESVPETQRLVGRNYGLRGPAFVLQILIPAALPSLISGLKIGWAFAWRTLIASELVFGVTSGSGGLGWFIYRSRNDLYTDKVFAGLAVVILIGLVVEIVLFRSIEKHTVRRWGMQK
ncbi:ABC transporter permease [Paracoccus sp. SY]|uniref:ABC transporter permease n=1 Tax=Paracoccus sp. SY TaxID=1330255 RepID=UPI000CD0AEDF|nr:ABC transporter permease [Paracoccus sp. SY]